MDYKEQAVRHAQQHGTAGDVELAAATPRAYWAMVEANQKRLDKQREAASQATVVAQPTLANIWPV